jgi:hypothetical protein
MALKPKEKMEKKAPRRIKVVAGTMKTAFRLRYLAQPVGMMLMPAATASRGQYCLRDRSARPEKKDAIDPKAKKLQRNRNFTRAPVTMDAYTPLEAKKKMTRGRK